MQNNPGRATGLTEWHRKVAEGFAAAFPLEPTSGVHPLRQAANDTPPLRLFIVVVKRGSEVVQHFPSLAVDAIAAADQNERLANKERGEYVVARPLGDYAALPPIDNADEDGEDTPRRIRRSRPEVAA